jgi:hypothetical protein
MASAKRSSLSTAKPTRETDSGLSHVFRSEYAEPDTSDSMAGGSGGDPPEDEPTGPYQRRDSDTTSNDRGSSPVTTYDKAGGSGDDPPSDQSDGDDEDSPEYEPGDLTHETALDIADGNEDAAKTLVAMDDKIADLAEDPDEGTKAAKEITGGTFGGISGAAAGASVGKVLGGIGGSVAGPVGSVAGAAAGGAIGGAIGGALGYTGKQMLSEGSVRGGLRNTMDAAGDFKASAVDKTPFVGDDDGAGEGTDEGGTKFE